jgi:hypothetical protein
MVSSYGHSRLRECVSDDATSIVNKLDPALEPR